MTELKQVNGQYKFSKVEKIFEIQDEAAIYQNIVIINSKPTLLVVEG